MNDVIKKILEIERKLNLILKKVDIIEKKINIINNNNMKRR